jgi:epoxyqueuosine reductase
MAVDSWEPKLQSFCEKVGASHAGVSKLETPRTWEHYENWLEKGFAAEMGYLKDHAETKRNPQSWKPTFKSAFVFAFPYVEHPSPRKTFSAVRTALYAQGGDYHYWIKERLNTVIEELSNTFPGEFFETHTDSSPLLERDLAERAGLGWFGKNTCLIHPKHGSLFLIGEILSTLDVQVLPAMLPDFCGKCTKCIEVCPTGAIPSPRVLDASKCISYLTIEAKTVPAENLRSQIGDWFFGCDLCQTNCPWNQKIFKTKLQVKPLLDLQTQEGVLLEAELGWILRSSFHQILKKVKGTPLYRAGARGLKRNALIVVGNRKLTGLKSDVQTLAKDPYLGELAQWTLKKLTDGSVCE